jgi:hypothetical protein
MILDGLFEGSVTVQDGLCTVAASPGSVCGMWLTEGMRRLIFILAALLVT